MSTYYVPPRQHSQSDASYRSLSASTSVESPIAQTADVPLEESIYIFPTPASTPASPSGSSAFSAPTELTDTFSLSTGTRSRDHSFSSSVPTRSQSPRHRLRTRDPADVYSVHRSLSRARSIATDDYDIEVEYWDWTAESGEDVPDDDGLWEFEAGVERASRWDVPMHLARRLSPLRPLGGANSGPNTDFYEQHYRVFLRSRTQSNASNVTSATSLSSHPIIPAPHPRIHIPLLSFFASLLSLNLDEPALRLLTHSSADSVLFPGQCNLLSDGAAPVWDTSSDDKPASEACGLLRLRHIDEDSRSSNHALKEGLAVACDSTLPNPFILPGFSALAGLYRLVGGVWSSAGKAWHEVQEPATLPSS